MEELQEDGRARLSVTGELDLATADAFAHRVRGLCGNGSRLLVDLSGIEFIDSRGLRALEHAVSDVRRAHGKLEIGPGLAAQVRRILEIAAVGKNPVGP